MRNFKFIAFVCCMVLLLAVVVGSEFLPLKNVGEYCDNVGVAGAENYYITTSEEFARALQGGMHKIYVGDITFATTTEIQLNYPVEIIGKDDKSTIENAYFKIVGTNVEDENIDISIKNIIFDGKVDKNALNLDEEVGKTFDEIFGETPQHSCIDGCIGYYTLNIDNSEIRNYLCEEGPAIYINNDTNYLAGKKVLNLTNTKVYNNVSNLGTVKVFSDKLTTTIDNCEFYGNLARAGQGIAVGNGKSTITNTKIHDNDFFRFVYFMEKRLPAIFHDDKETNPSTGITINTLGRCCGALFIGGSHAVVDNCEIYNNKTIYGGGIGIINASTLVGGEKIEIKNTDIVNNEALLCGGAIYLQSNQGETTYFTNCNILGNKAGEKGSIIYTTTYAPDDNTKLGGNVQFAFCTMVGNQATDDADTFTYYDLLEPKTEGIRTLAGLIMLKGCFVIDESPYSENGEEYTYVATKSKALLDGVVTIEMLNDLSNGISPIKGSVADIEVPANVYATWIGGDALTLEARKIGTYVESANEETSAVEEKQFPYWVIIFPVLAVVGIVVAVVVVYRKKKAKANESANTENVEDNVIEAEEDVPPIDYRLIPYAELYQKVSEIYFDKNLTKKELDVATTMLMSAKRKEIAERLYLSEATVKSHLLHIFQKVNVSTRQEFKALTDRLMHKRYPSK